MSPFVGFGVLGNVLDAVAFGGDDSIGLPAMQLGAQVDCAKRFVGHGHLAQGHDLATASGHAKRCLAAWI